jgi:CBS domain containing-hemolysin-like protein
MTMSNHQASLVTGERSEHGSSWFNRLAANFGFSGNADARAVIETALAEDDGTAFTPRERAMLQRVLQFKDLRLEDVMVPRVDIVAIEEGASMAELMALLGKAGHSRIPVYRDTLDEPLGMVHVKDLLAWLMNAGKVEAGSAAPHLGGVDLGTSIAESGIVREVIFAPASMSALDLLVRMQARHIHLALIIDEYGGTDGLVSIEDLLEEVVGNIEDEHDASHAPMIAEDEEGFVADARADVEDVEARIGHSLTSRNGEDIDTIGGLIFSLLGRVPAPGEVIGHPAGIRFEILDADGRRIKKVRIRPMGPAAGGGAETGPPVLMAFK